jgi:hypothetical protein
VRPATLYTPFLVGLLGCGLGLNGRDEGGDGASAAATTPGGPSGRFGDLSPDGNVTDDGDLGVLALDAWTPDEAGSPSSGDASGSTDDAPFLGSAEATADTSVSTLLDANSPCAQLESCCKTLSVLGTSSSTYQSCEGDVQNGDAGTCQSALLALAFVGACL